MPSLHDELTALINRRSIENASNTPDFILAHYLQDVLAALNVAINSRTAYMEPAAPAVTDDMVTRFLSWRLPEDFAPDCFVRFNHVMARETKSWPTGTNVLHAGQARAMLEHVLGVASAPNLRPTTPAATVSPAKPSAEQQPMHQFDTGGPAFPVGEDALMRNLQGMTLRDYFAAKAMQGLMSMERASEFVDESGIEMDYEVKDTAGTLFVHTDYLPQEAYMIADAMLQARKGAAA